MKSITISSDGFFIAQKNSGSVQGAMPEDLFLQIKNLVKEEKTELELLVEIALPNASKEQAIRLKDYHEKWEKDTSYTIGDRRIAPKEDGSLGLYECRQNHTSQEIYPPFLVPALWYDIEGHEEQEYQVLPWEDRWKTQKKGYLVGNRVIHKGYYWRSKIGEEGNYNYHEPSDDAHAAWEKEGEHLE